MVNDAGFEHMYISKENVIKVPWNSASVGLRPLDQAVASEKEKEKIQALNVWNWTHQKLGLFLHFNIHI